MLTQINEFAKNYEYLIKAIGALIPILLTIFMAYIAYQQWFILKRDSTLQLCKESQKKYYRPLKKYLSSFIQAYGLPPEQKEKADRLRKKSIENIKNLFKENPYLINEYNDDVIKYSFDELCKTYEQKSNELVIKNSWFFYKKAVKWLLNTCISENCRVNLHPNDFPNIYIVSRQILKCLYQFLLPNFIKNIIYEIYSNIGLFIWTRILIIHMLIETFKTKFRNKPKN